MRDSQTIAVPNGLLSDMKDWVEQELEWAAANTQHKRDLEELHDRISAAENEVT